MKMQDTDKQKDRTPLGIVWDVCRSLAFTQLFIALCAVVVVTFVWLLVPSSFDCDGPDALSSSLVTRQLQASPVTPSERADWAKRAVQRAMMVNPGGRDSADARRHFTPEGLAQFDAFWTDMNLASLKDAEKLSAKPMLPDPARPVQTRVVGGNVCEWDIVVPVTLTLYDHVQRLRADAQLEMWLSIQPVPGATGDDAFRISRWKAGQG
jgi:hypothetical protein